MRFAATTALLSAALLLVATASADVSPVKRLAWVKASAAWTAQAKKSGYATACLPYTVTRGSLTCTVYDPEIDSSSSTIVAGEHHRVAGSVLMARYDRPRSGMAPARSGCTYEVDVFAGSAKTGGQATVIDICAPGWLRRLPALSV